MKKFLNILPFLALTFAILFNFWLFRPELTIKSDPNDSIFQFALVNRANSIWESYGCPWSFPCWIRLFDHWVPEWAEGYPLPFYYSHFPQIFLVTTYHFFAVPTCVLTAIACSLFSYYHLITYLALSLFPLSLFLSLRVMGFSLLVQTFGVLFASHISTDGLYGMDISSYLWRGYGLSSQLFAWLFLPLAFAYTFKALQNGFRISHSSKAVFFLFLTLSSHFGLGYITLISFLPLLFMSFNRREIIARVKKLFFIVTVTIALLAYWVIPFLKEANFNAISPWDPMWKFDSFGYVDVLVKFFHGDLIDFGRGLPVLTLLTLVGFFAVLLGGEGLHSLALLFPLWLLLFFGRTTWGPLIDLLPGMAGFHLHRFINGLHLSVLFLAPIGAAWVFLTFLRILIGFFGNLRYIRNISKATIYTIVSISLTLATCYVLLTTLYPRTLSYNRPNGEWIAAQNTRFDRDWKDFSELVSTLRKLPPGRIYAGKPGYWGRDFKIGDTQLYMALSVRGFETSQFLPETWSPNSDTEQFFDERQKKFYELYNVRYVVAPESVQFPDFVQLKKKFGKFLLYEIETGGYFSIGTSNLAVLTNRTFFPNLVHLWQISPLVEYKLFPVLTFSRKELSTYPNSVTLIDVNRYRTGRGDEYSIFGRSPLYIDANYATPAATFREEKVFAGQRYETRVDVGKDCIGCLIIFKTTYHPNWSITIDGIKAEKVITFPFFIGTPIKPGNHVVVASYEPSKIKLLLLIISIGGVTLWLSKKILDVYRLLQKTRFSQKGAEVTSSFRIGKS